MKGYRRVALICLVSAVVLLTAHLTWSFAATDTPPAFLPPAGESLEGKTPFRFAVVGDNRGNNTVFDEILARIKQDGANLVIHTGDIVERCTERQYEWILHELEEANLSVPFCAVPGNHDMTDAGTNPCLLYQRAFGPRRYWFSYGDTLFVGLGNYGKSCTEQDLDWLDSVLSRYRGSYKGCFVFTHVPPRDPRPGAGHALPEVLGEHVMEILKKHDVTALFAGHIHSYLEDEMDGIPIYITGGAGAERDEPIGPHHYLLCTVQPGGKLDVRKVDVPDRVNTDYPEYAFRVKFPVGASLVGVALLLLAGIVLVKNAFLRAG